MLSFWLKLISIRQLQKTNVWTLACDKNTMLLDERPWISQLVKLISFNLFRKARYFPDWPSHWWNVSGYIHYFILVKCWQSNREILKGLSSLMYQQSYDKRMVVTQNSFDKLCEALRPSSCWSMILISVHWLQIDKDLGFGNLARTYKGNSGEDASTIMQAVSIVKIVILVISLGIYYHLEVS
jgi:hypothetical protein